MHKKSIIRIVGTSYIDTPKFTTHFEITTGFRFFNFKLSKLSKGGATLKWKRLKVLYQSHISLGKDNDVIFQLECFYCFWKPCNRVEGRKHVRMNQDSLKF